LDGSKTPPISERAMNRTIGMPVIHVPQLVGLAQGFVVGEIFWIT
jgi:heterodisulfide reductase subunit B